MFYNFKKILSEKNLRYANSRTMESYLNNFDEKRIKEIKKICKSLVCKQIVSYLSQPIYDHHKQSALSAG